MSRLLKSTIAGVILAAASIGYVAAQPGAHAPQPGSVQANIPSYNPHPSTCPAGFSLTQSAGIPNGNHSYTCTANVMCASTPGQGPDGNNPSTGITPSAVNTGKGKARLSYRCEYTYTK